MSKEVAQRKKLVQTNSLNNHFLENCNFFFYFARESPRFSFFVRFILKNLKHVTFNTRMKRLTFYHHLKKLRKKSKFSSIFFSRMAGRERSARARKSISATSGSKNHECGTQFLKVRLADSKPTSIEFDNVSQSKRVRVCSKTKSPNFKYKCGLCGMRAGL